MFIYLVHVQVANKLPLSFLPLKSSGVQQQYPVCPPVKSQFHFKVLIYQFQQNIFKYTAFNFYPWRAPPVQINNEEKNQTARPPKTIIDPQTSL